MTASNGVYMVGRELTSGQGGPPTPEPALLPISDPLTPLVIIVFLLAVLAVIHRFRAAADDGGDG